MLNPFKRTKAHKLRIVADPHATRADLEIRNLMDFPSLRQAMGLDQAQMERQEVAA